MRVLERAVVSFELRAGCVELSLADICKRSSCLWVISKFLPLGAPGCERLPVLRASSFGNFRSHAIVVRSQETVAFRDADLFGARRVSVPVGYDRGRRRRRVRIRWRRCICISVRFRRFAAGKH